MTFNAYGVWAIYRFEMARAMRTLWQSLVTPVITTALYFVVFGSAIGHRMTEVDLASSTAPSSCPGLIMLSLFTQSIFNASFGVLLPEVHRHDLRDPVRAGLLDGDRHRLCRRRGGKSVVLALVILGTAALFTPLQILHPVWMLLFLVLIATTFSLFRLHHRRLGRRLRATPGHSHADRHPPDLPGRGLLFDRDAAGRLEDRQPVQPHRLSDLRLPLDLHGSGDVGVGISVLATLGFLFACLVAIAWIFRTGYRLKN